ncbi:MAG: TonB-dependent receptor [Pseudomonadales bacterium]|nr:TonB-dependent receptor [Pseudomonadales bacterium]
MSRVDRSLGFGAAAWVLATALLVISPISAPPVFAQNAPQVSQTSGMLDEVMVTARKVEENLMTVPLAITAFSAKDIESQGIKQLGDIMLMTPSFYFVNQTGSTGRNDRSSTALVFRGLYLGNNTGLNAGGQLFVDGAPVIGAQPPAIVDVARVEVLKGPQSAYFGRSTFVGAINFVTIEPGDEFKGKVSLEGASYGTRDASISVEGPLVAEKLTGRLTYRDSKVGGPYANNGVIGGRLGEQKTQSISGSLVYKPTDQLKIKAYVNAFKNDDGPPAGGALKSSEFNGRIAPDGTCVPFSQAPAGTAALGQTAGSRASFGYFCGTVPQADEYAAHVISGDYDTAAAATQNALFNPDPNWLVFDPSFRTKGGFSRKAFQADLRIDYEFADGYNLSALSAMHNDKTQTLIDLNTRDGHDRPNPLYALNPATRVPWQQFLLLSQGKLRDWSQEVRLTSPADQRLRWTVGANYLKAGSPGGTVYGESVVGPLFVASITRNDVETPAVFAAAYFDFTDALTLSVEGRYQWDKIKATPIVGGNGRVVTGAAANPLQATFKSFAPRISIDYEYAPNSTLYALFSRGYRPGGFNPSLATSSQATIDALRAIVPNAGVTYDQEQLDNLEVGVKSTWLNGRARTTLTLYKDKWLDGQVQNSIPVVVTGVANLFGITVNNGEAELKGVEFEAQLQATDHLRLSASFGLNKTEIKSYGLGDGNCADCNLIYGKFSGAIGRRLPTTPETAWSFSSDYSHKLREGVDWFGRLDFQRQGAKLTDFAGATQVGASNNLNARFGVRGEHVTAEVFGTNLTDNKVLQTALLGTDAFTFILQPTKSELRFSLPTPRVYGVRMTYSF